MLAGIWLNECKSMGKIPFLTQWYYHSNNEIAAAILWPAPTPFREEVHFCITTPTF